VDDMTLMSQQRRQVNNVIAL